MQVSRDKQSRYFLHIICWVAHFYEKGKSGNKKEVQMKEDKTKEVQTEKR